MAKKQYRSRIAEAVHTAVAGMHKTGTVSNETMRHFDESCLASPANLEPAQIKALRESHNLGEPAFVNLDVEL